MPTPNWQGARNGLPGDSNAVDKSAQVNQFLGAHGVTPIYQGNAAVNAGAFNYFPKFIWGNDNSQYAQTFTLPGGTTAIGRVEVPWMPTGNGCDLLVSLYTDSGGVPGTSLASVRVPARWFTTLAAVQGILGTSVPTAGATNPLANARSNILMPGPVTTVTWSPPSTSASGHASGGARAFGGNYFVEIGGQDSATSNSITTVWSVPYLGPASIGSPTLQPSIPQAAGWATAVATPDTIVFAGGFTAGTSSPTAAVFCAGWNPNNGSVGTWSAQPALPQPVAYPASAASGSTVYVIGGYNGTTTLSTVYYATVQNGQISQWNTSQPLPVAVEGCSAAVVDNFLIVTGGLESDGVTYNPNTYYAPIAADGSLSQWIQASSSLSPSSHLSSYFAIPNAGFVVFSGFTTGGALSSAIQTISVSSSDGLGRWRFGNSGFGQVASPGAVFQRGPGIWDVFVFFSTGYWSFPIYTVPIVSVPLPVSGLTGGGTYHLVMQMINPDRNNYLQVGISNRGPLGVLHNAPAGSSTWTTFAAGFEIPIWVYDQTAGGPPLHTWEDGGKRITTLVNASTPDARLLGALEATTFADGTVLADAAAINYPGIWPGGAWPPQGVTQLA